MNIGQLGNRIRSSKSSITEMPVRYCKICGADAERLVNTPGFAPVPVCHSHSLVLMDAVTNYVEYQDKLLWNLRNGIHFAKDGLVIQFSHEDYKYHVMLDGDDESFATLREVVDFVRHRTGRDVIFEFVEELHDLR